MIPFEKGYLGLATIFQVHGSSLPRALIPALYSFAVTMLMFYVPTSHGDMQWRHYFMLLMPDWKAFQIFGSITMFLLVFRTQLSYSRYWEGVGKVQGVTSNWTSAAAHALAFAKNTPSGPRSFDRSARKAAEEEVLQEEVAKDATFYHDMIHLVSLVHALAIQDLRLDDNLDNIIPYLVGDAASNPSLIIKWSWKESRISNETSKVARTLQWIKRNFLGKFSQEMWANYCGRSKLGVVGGLQECEKDILLAAHDRCFLVFGWLCDLVAQHYQTEFAVHPPIVSRVFHELALGHNDFMQAKKIRDIPYPFPYAQLSNCCLAMFATTLPIIVSSAFTSPDPASLPSGVAFEHINAISAAMCSFIITMTFYGVSEVAREIEDPFVHYPNELPLAYMQSECNMMLLSLNTPWPRKASHLFQHPKAPGESLGLSTPAPLATPTLVASVAVATMPAAVPT